MSNLLIDADKQIVIKIAARFLEQHHSVTSYHASLQGDYWLVTARVGLFPEQIKKVRIDAKNGKIIDYT
jgi:hypothetical protein